MIDVSKEPLETCCACGSDNLELISELPKFPHIGIFLDDYSKTENYPLVDNSVCACAQCGHVQLGYTVDASFLYPVDFQHKTSHSVSAMQANNVLFDFAQKVCAGKKVSLVAEIGCNDTFLLQKFAETGADVVGVDPILKGREAQFVEGLEPELVEKFNVLGDFIENANFSETFSRSPDLYVTNFVFEHLRNPYEVTKNIIESAKDDATIIIGVPGAEFLLLNNRFDQLSHQHYQQFTIPSLTRMVQRAGGEVIDIFVNFANWGQILIAFKKGGNKPTGAVDMALSVDQIKQSFRVFRQQIDMLKERVRTVEHKPIYGFGAAQNFPVFAYFYEDSLPFTEILDDHPLRQNKTFPHYPVKITKPKDSYKGAVGILTGPDYARVLVSRMGEMEFDHIIVPFTSL
ncbi:MAG: methyltransferase domain-containing protein [Rhodospirillaceae bacterium]|nr:methyltransferase domain-containing protein [Rhodospirillaceae bacterium]